MATYENRNGNWRASVRKQGYKVTKTFDTKSRAKAWAIKTEVEINTGVWLDNKNVDLPTLDEIIEIYLDAKPAKGSKLATMRALQRHFTEFPIRQFTNPEVLKYVKMRRKTVVGHTVATELGYLRKAIDYVRTFHGVPLPANPIADTTGPLRDVDLIAASEHRDRRLEGNEFDRLLKACYGKRGNHWLGPIFEIAVYSGLRQGEIHRLEWEYINFEKNTVGIPSRKTKGHKRKETGGGTDWIIPMLPMLREALSRVSFEGCKGKVFKKPRTSGAISDRFARICKELNIEDLTFHDLRHEALSRLFEDKEAKYSIPQVALISGHRDWQSLKRYTNLKAENF